MAAKRRQFRRPVGDRPYRKVFVIATEGEKTEPTYFKKIFDNQEASIHVICLASKHDSAPQKVLERLKRYLKEEGLKKDDEAWVVVDTDCWTNEQLRFLSDWSEQHAYHGLAVSNPCFEYWLLLHFEDGNDIANSGECLERLKRFLPNYAKSRLEITKLKPGIQDAVRRAAIKDQSEEVWPTTTETTVYRLVRNLLDDKTKK